MKVRNIPPNLVKYLKRAALWHTNTSPYLSGDVFADFADVSLFPPILRSLGITTKQISEARVVFCPSHLFEKMMDEYGADLKPKVLILGNSDRDFTIPLVDVPVTVRKIFCQNLMFYHPLYTPLPIGVENSRLGTNGLKQLFTSSHNVSPKKSKILLGPFSNTHEDRIDIEGNIYSSADIYVADGRLSPKEYSMLAAEYQFVASPRGNGQDTHRFWETLYRGGLPIVKSNEWTRQFIDIGFPLLEVSDWSQEELIRTLHQNTGNWKSARELPQLWWPWWKSRIESYIVN